MIKKIVAYNPVGIQHNSPSRQQDLGPIERNKGKVLRYKSDLFDSKYSSCTKLVEYISDPYLRESLLRYVKDNKFFDLDYNINLLITIRDLGNGLCSQEKKEKINSIITAYSINDASLRIDIDDEVSLLNSLNQGELKILVMTNLNLEKHDFFTPPPMVLCDIPLGTRTGRNGNNPTTITIEGGETHTHKGKGKGEKTELIGMGTYGIVKRNGDNAVNKKVIVYVRILEQLYQVPIEKNEPLVPITKDQAEQLMIILKKEVTFLSRLNGDHPNGGHPNIVPFDHAVCYYAKKAIPLPFKVDIEMGFVTQGKMDINFGYLRLLLAIDKITSKNAFENPIKKAALEVALGLNFAHHNGIIQRDLKGDNLLQDEKGKVVVSDFGKSAHQDDTEELKRSVGDPYYRSPEMMEETQEKTNKTDTWSYAATLYEMYTGKKFVVLGKENLSELDSFLKKFDQKKWHIPKELIPKGVSETFNQDFQSFLRKAFNPDPNKRPSIAELLNDPFLDMSDEEMKLTEETWETVFKSKDEMRRWAT